MLTLKNYLLCTDLDRTLIPNGVQPISPGAQERFAQLVSHKEITLTYVTGRSLALIEQAIAEFDLPKPDYVIANVGTAILQRETTGWQQWHAWEEEIAPDWRGLTSEKIHPIFRHMVELQPQERAKQDRYKLSYYVPLSSNVQRLADSMRVLLEDADIRANLIQSIDTERKVGLLDVVPASANKLHAIRFLMQHAGFLPEHTVFAGDSGNDLDVLMSGIPSVLVANAEADVRQAVSTGSETLYVAKGGYLGMNGNYSAGILEGAAHFFTEIDIWLKETNHPN